MKKDMTRDEVIAALLSLNEIELQLIRAKLNIPVGALPGDSVATNKRALALLDHVDTNSELTLDSLIIKLQEQDLENKRRHLGKEHPDVLDAMDNIAQKHFQQQDYSKAQSIQENILEICTRVYNEDQLKVVRAMSNLSQTLLAQNKYLDAQNLQQRILELMRQFNGEKPPSTVEEWLVLISERYTINFAGLSAMTRDLSELEKIILWTKEMREDSFRVKGIEGDRLRKRADNMINIYESVKINITQAQSQNPSSIEEHLLADRVDSIYHYYTRHFAGQNRSTRNTSLLQFMIEEIIHLKVIAGLRQEKQPSINLKRIQGFISSHIELFYSELKAIEGIQKTAKPSSQFSDLANRANAQFKLYADHFSKKRYNHVYPRLLNQICVELEIILDGMIKLKKAYTLNEVLDKNISNVESRLKIYQEQLIQIREVHEDRRDNMIEVVQNNILDLQRQHKNWLANSDDNTQNKSVITILLDEVYEGEWYVRQLLMKDDGYEDLKRSSYLQRICDVRVRLMRKYNSAKLD